jgi:hypothetical protein
VVPPLAYKKVGMAYNKAKLYEQAKEAITKNNLFFVEDIVAFIPCTKPTFYDYFKVDSNEFNTLKDLLEQNKIKTKSAIRAKLFKGEKAAELLSLYRLICTNEERQMLNQQYIESRNTNENTIIWKEEKTYEAKPKADPSN